MADKNSDKSLIKELTAEVTALKAGRDMLCDEIEKLKETETRFFMRIVHDLGSPLIAMGAALSYVLEKKFGELTAEQEKYIGIAKKNVDELYRLVSELPDSYKIKMGKATGSEPKAK